MDYAHRQGVIHRDIKPANILMHEGQPMIADFGIALAVSEASDQRLTETGLSIGTPHYMSPEQATGDQEPDPRSDVYSLGAMLYEMLAGEPPYSGSTAQAILREGAHVEAESGEGRSRHGANARGGGDHEVAAQEPGGPLQHGVRVCRRISGSGLHCAHDRGDAGEDRC